MGICLELASCLKRCFVVNVYSKGGEVEKRELREVQTISKRGFWGWSLVRRS